MGIKQVHPLRFAFSSSEQPEVVYQKMFDTERASVFFFYYSNEYFEV